MTAAVAFEHPRQAAAGAIIVAALTSRRAGYDGTTAAARYCDAAGNLHHDGHRITAVDAAAAAAVILDRIVDDMAHVIGMDPVLSLSRIGAWVAAQEG